MKRVFCLILVLFTIYSCLSGCSDPDEQAPSEMITEVFTEAPTETIVFDIEEYKDDARKYSEILISNAILLNEIVQYQAEYWKSLEALSGSVSAQKLFDKGMEWSLTNKGYGQEFIEYQHEDIKDRYQDIVSQDNLTKEAEEIEQLIKELFDVYLGFYGLAFSPSGSREEFVNNNNNFVEDFSRIVSKLDAFLY